MDRFEPHDHIYLAAVPAEHAEDGVAGSGGVPGVGYDWGGPGGLYRVLPSTLLQDPYLTYSRI